MNHTKAQRHRGTKKNKKNVLKNNIRGTFGLVVLVFVIMISGCFKSKSSNDIIPFTYKLKKANNQITVIGIGKVEAVKEKLVSAPRIRAQMVIEYMPEEGSTVNTDEVVVRFDTKNLEIRNSQTFLDLKHKKIDFQNKILEDDQKTFDLTKTIEKKSANLDCSTDVYKILKKGKDPDEISKYSINISRDKVDEKKYSFRIASRKKLLEKGFISELEFSKLNFELQKTIIQKNKDQNYYQLLKSGSDKIDLEKYSIEQEKYSIGKKLAVDNEKSSIKVNALTLKKTKFDLDSKEAKAKRMKKEIKKCIIKAPTSGIILYQKTWSGKVGIGTNVWPGMALVKILNLERLKINACIDEKDIELVKNGARTEITALSTGDKIYTGRVTKIEKIAQLKEKGDIKGAKFFNVSILLDGKNLKIKPLETVSVKIICKNIPESIRIPKDFVYSKNKNELFVNIKNGSAKVKTKITPFANSSDYYFITEGLETGMKIFCNN